MAASTPENTSSEEYKFFDFRPHHESPISDESFWQLDIAIALAYSAAGIGGRMEHGRMVFEERSYAYSPPRYKGGPHLSISRYIGPRIEGTHAEESQATHLIVLTLSTSLDRLGLSMMLRNDAGTPSYPNQVAGDVTIGGQAGLIHYKEQLKDQDITLLAQDIKERNQDEKLRFVKKYSKPVIFTPFLFK